MVPCWNFSEKHNFLHLTLLRHQNTKTRWYKFSKNHWVWHFLKCLGLPERNYNLQLLWITLYQTKSRTKCPSLKIWITAVKLIYPRLIKFSLRRLFEEKNQFDREITSTVQSSSMSSSRSRFFSNAQSTNSEKRICPPSLLKSKKV